jgi:hypothetical protein
MCIWCWRDHKLPSMDRIVSEMVQPHIKANGFTTVIPNDKITPDHHFKKITKQKVKSKSKCSP